MRYYNCSYRGSGWWDVRTCGLPLSTEDTVSTGRHGSTLRDVMYYQANIHQISAEQPTFSSAYCPELVSASKNEHVAMIITAVSVRDLSGAWERPVSEIWWLQERPTVKRAILRFNPGERIPVLCLLILQISCLQV